MFQKQKKSRVFHTTLSIQLHSTLNLTGAEASRTDVNVTRGTINHCLNTSNIGFPSSVGTSVGVGHLDTECYTLLTNFAFSHLLHLL